MSDDEEVGMTLHYWPIVVLNMSKYSKESV